MRFFLASIVLGAFLGGTDGHLISQKNKLFSASTLTVKTGEKVVFKNDDSVPHNVFSGSQGYAFNLKSQAPGTESSISFDKAGTIEVRCAFHPTMKLTVTVTP